MKEFFLFSVIGLILLYSCSKDEESVSPHYFVSVIQEKEFSVDEIKNRYPEIFIRYSSLSVLLQNIHVTAIRYRTRTPRIRTLLRPVLSLILPTKK